MDYSGRVAIVSGGTRRLGRAIAKARAGAGCDVTVCGRSEPVDLPEGIGFHAADVRQPDQAAKF